MTLRNRTVRLPVRAGGPPLGTVQDKRLVMWSTPTWKAPGAFSVQQRYDRKLWIVEPVTPLAYLPG